VARKVLLILTALLIPGGLLALVGAFLVTRMARSEGGQRFLIRSKERANRFRRWVKRVPAVRPALPADSSLQPS
jgi:hypothetical protein